MSDSIFEFGDKFGIKSSFGNWLKAEDIFEIKYLSYETITEGEGENQREFYLISFQYTSNVNRNGVIFSLKTNEELEPLSLAKKPLNVTNSTNVLTIKYGLEYYKERLAKKKNFSFYISATYVAGNVNKTIKTELFDLVYLSFSNINLINEQNQYKIEFSLYSNSYPVDVKIQMMHQIPNKNSIISNLEKQIKVNDDKEKFTFSVNDAVFSKRLKENKKSRFVLVAHSILEEKCFFKSDILAIGCWCNRNFQLQELTQIILELRKTEDGVKDNSLLFYANNCKLKEEDKSIKRLCEELNKTFKKFNISKCIHKIHFLAQIYHETDRLRTLTEYNTKAEYKPYIGRGLMQLTHKSNYKIYTAFVNNDLGNNVDFVDNYTNIENDLYYAVDSGGWFWNQGKVLNKGETWKPPSTAPAWVKVGNPSFPRETKSYKYKKEATIEYGTINFNNIAEKDMVDVISYLVNGGSYGLQERRDYLSSLKKIMKYDQCINKK